MTYILSVGQLEALIDILHRQGRTTIGPVVQDGVITHDEFNSLTDLAQGWTEEQDAGRYRLEPTGTPEFFAFSSPSTSWKRFLHPERSLLITARRLDGHIEVVHPAPEAPSLAFFGIRSCDLAALDVLDRVFLDPDAIEPTYATRRPNVFIVAAACNHPGTTCFCASMDTGPTPRTGFDLSLRELHGDGHHRFLAEAGSDEGAALLCEVRATPASESTVAAGQDAHVRAVSDMGRSLDAADPPLAAADLDQPHWDDVASRCLACGNCTMVCPTCFCSTTEDTTDHSGETAERWKAWDSCFTLDFTHLHGDSSRSSTKSRYRHWLLHKLVTWHEQFGTSGCVGCGRCITWCPVGIDLTAEIATLAQRQREREQLL